MSQFSDPIYRTKLDEELPASNSPLEADAWSDCEGMRRVLRDLRDLRPLPVFPEIMTNGEVRSAATMLWRIARGRWTAETVRENLAQVQADQQNRSTCMMPDAYESTVRVLEFVIANAE